MAGKDTGLLLSTCRGLPKRIRGTPSAPLHLLLLPTAGVRVIRPAVAESTAIGAAYAAGLAVGVWADTAALSAQWRAAAEWTPAMPRAEAAARIRRWDAAVKRSFGWESLAKGGADAAAEAEPVKAAAASAAATAPKQRFALGPDTAFARALRPRMSSRALALACAVVGAGALGAALGVSLTLAVARAQRR